MNADKEDGLTVTTERLLGLRRYLRPPFGGRWHPDQRPAGFPGKRRGAGLETVDVRVFTEGDDVRHLDRNVSARTGIPHVRSFREERGATLLLIADYRYSMLWGTRRMLRSVAAAEALALGGWRAVEAGGRVGLYVIGQTEHTYVAPRGRVTGMAAVAGALAAGHTEAISKSRGNDTTLDFAIEAVTQLAPVGASLVLATALDDPGPEFTRLAGALARFNRLRVILVRDAFETTPPPGSYSFATASGERHWAYIGGTPPPDARLAELERLGVATMLLETRGGPEAAADAWDWFDGTAN